MMGMDWLRSQESSKLFCCKVSTTAMEMERAWEAVISAALASAVRWIVCEGALNAKPRRSACSLPDPDILELPLLVLQPRLVARSLAMPPDWELGSETPKDVIANS